MFKAHRVIEAAEQHGRESEPDHEVGDLQDALRAAIGIMSVEQIKVWSADESVRNILEAGGDSFEEDLGIAEKNRDDLAEQKRTSATRTIDPTPSQISRLATDYGNVAGEPVRVEVIKGRVYVFASELGALRMFYKNRLDPKSDARADFSQNYNSWFFAFDIVKPG